jgi:prevent-host-death family protein
VLAEADRIDHDPNLKGNVAELAIATEAARLGLSVFKPLTEHERCDLVLGIGGELVRVQCKWAACHEDVIQVRLRSSYHSPTRGYVVTTYDAEEVDFVAVYCADADYGFYLLPAPLFQNRKTLHLRLGPARNGQRAALHFAADYRLPGAVAQLAERSDGIRKVRGSIPLSSIIGNRSSEGPAEEVGAHEFRNHFGYYMERAAGGGEVLVRRHGRPYARLGPA